MQHFSLAVLYSMGIIIVQVDRKKSWKFEGSKNKKQARKWKKS